MLQVNLQKKIFSGYPSLNLQDKLYQVKALELAQRFSKKHKSYMTLLDIGCADGSFANYAGKLLHAKTNGIDISPGSIIIAKKSLDKALQLDASKPLPFADNSFDIIFALEVIEHLYDTDLFLLEIKRVLKPGGILIVSTPNLASLKNRIRLLFNLYPQYLEYSTAGAGHIHLYTSQVLLSQLKEHGFLLKTFASVNFLAPYVTHQKAPDFYRKLAMRLGDWLPTFGSHIIALVAK